MLHQDRDLDPELLLPARRVRNHLLINYLTLTVGFWGFGVLQCPDGHSLLLWYPAKGSLWSRLAADENYGAHGA